jgi:hypothetical protein
LATEVEMVDAEDLLHVLGVQQLGTVGLERVDLDDLPGR